MSRTPVARRACIRVFLAVRSASFVAALGPALLASGCATPIHLSSLVDQDETGSIPAPVSPLSPALDSEDWRRARGALAVALDPQGNGAPVAWKNPKSGAGGSFTPVGDAYARDDTICRAFTAEVKAAALTKKVQGKACRTGAGEWKVADIRAVKS